ncbi:heparan-alpha-glucosaminide N-acetyltransferase domain-containing protein [Muricauda sp. 2012CJ35-5]|uniref:Heparan-alpha-glucosaminide N-acetyltransferase domain-containing protein n=1 Tax=Flagellimonas spongiicola TaxID=2942208 RepID=A0ABT0PS27_9FLAO|nr:heparan-alpha-glucosaminide N-acetyltransferase domain-containing protein [Allomuricauda spongiicola]MCL6274193.1 heparan-alpha-glucosaminide N-acetyltransferase domain-containing protein [Allomuricauda spongiicola]
MKDRIVAVDIFRGLTIVLMILVNTPGTWSNVYAPLLHAKWHGYTPTDLVFPFFLFIVGTSIVFAYKNKQANSGTYKKITVRSLKLIGLGLFLGAFTISFPFIKEFAAIRFPGVLQRIGVVFFFAAILFLNLDWKKLVGLALVLLVGYWAMMTLIPVEGVTSTLERAPNNFANYLDVKIFGSHNYKPDYDPEGLLSTIPSIVSALMGIFTGLVLASKRDDKIKSMLLMGAGLVVLGHIWDLVFPINKALWTSSFVLVTAGWANLVLALIYYITDVKKIQFGSIFRYAGANAITVYFLSSFITKLFYSIKVDGEMSVHGWLFNTIYVHDFMSMKLSSMLYGLSVAGFYCLLAYIMYKRKLFIKV